MVLEAIESIRHQPYSDLEIIVVDDGSKDNTQAEINSLFPEVQLVALDGIGPGPARNAGVNASTGNVLMFLDSDDIWLENHVRQLMDTLGRGYQVAYGTTKIIDEVGKQNFIVPDEGAGLEGDCFEQLIRWCFMFPSSLAVSRKAFMVVNGFEDITYGEDWIFFLKLSAQFPFCFSGPQPITLRKLHEGSFCFLSDKKKLLGIINQVYTFLKKESKATKAHLDHFTMLHDWTDANMDQWSTVQDWYLEMVKEKII